MKGDRLPSSRPWVYEGFLMTYPCFLPLRGNEPHTLFAGMKDCLTIFTDADLLERFCNKFDLSKHEYLQMDDQAAFLECLRRFQGRSTSPGQSIQHIAIDPGDAPLALTISIRDMIKQFESK